MRESVMQTTTLPNTHLEPLRTSSISAALRQDAFKTAAPSTMVPLGDLQAGAATAQLASTTSITPNMRIQQPNAHQPAHQQQPVDPILNILLQDASFLAAVKQQDVSAAAVTAAKLIKQNLTQIIAKLKPTIPSLSKQGSLGSGGSPMHVSESELVPRTAARRSSDSQQLGPDGWPSSSSRGRDIQPGDWVVVRSSNKTTDPDLIGQQGVVNKLELNGWVELSIPKLGRVVKLQQRYLTHVSTENMSSMPQKNTSSINRLLSEDLNRQPLKRPNLGGPYHQTAYTSSFLPARVAPLMGRGISKMKEIVKSVRKEMLNLEESIPWNAVDGSWKVKRPVWRKNLKNLETSTKVAEHLVAHVATAMLELHEALATDKSAVGGGVFARGGPWEQRLQQLADGGNNYMALQQVWEEMYEAVRQWLGGGDARGGAAVVGGAMMHHGHDKMSNTSVYRAFAALDSAAERGDSYLSQVPLERIVGVGREGLSMLRSLVEREKHHILGRMDSIGRGDLLGLSPEEVAAENERLGLLMSPGLRAELHSIHSIESEVDTDVDDGPDATDMEDSD